MAPDQAWALLQNSSDDLQLWSVHVGQSADGAQLGAELLATLPSDNGLLSKAGQVTSAIPLKTRSVASSPRCSANGRW